MSRESELHSLLVESVSDYAIFVLDPGGHVLTWNLGAQRLKGYRADEIVGQSFTKFYPADAVASGFPQHELTIASREGRFEDEGWRVRKDGSQFWANVVITALRDGDGTLIGFAKVTRDLTARRAAEEQARRLAAEVAAHAEAARRSEELAHLNDQLQEQAVEMEAQAEEMHALIEEQEETNEHLQRATKLREEILAVVAHDLRDPVHAIAMAASVMLELPLSEEQRVKQLTVVKNSAHRMDRLIGDLLDVSRIDSGNFAIRRAPLQIRTLLQETVDAFELQASPRRIQLTAECAPGVPPVMGDRDRLTQVLGNVVGNALKFTPEGGYVRLHAALRDTAVHVSVEDSGAGIPGNKLPHVFDWYWQAEHASRAGAGLGLAIARGIVNAHGGRIWAESTVGSGTTVHFTIPAATS